MATAEQASPARRSRLRVPMRARDVGAHERAATPLELFFDLCFVVAVAQAGEGLHHAVADDHVAQGVVGYLSVFFAIWWAWMNFTWFASAYDTDDAPYRIATLVQIVGVLVLAAGVPAMFERGDLVVVTLGYTIMRVALVAQWLRAARGHPEGRRTAHRYAAGISGLMLAWGLLLLVPPQLQQAGFLTLVVCELLVPRWAERAGRSPWHAGHIEERYALFTIIVLGESVFAATTAIQAVVVDGVPLAGLAGLVGGTPLVVFAMWWLYFAKPEGSSRPPVSQAFVWGYGHLVVFASASAVGVGVVVGLDEATGHAAIGPTVAAAALTVPAAVFVVTVWALHLRVHHHDRTHAVLFPLASALVLAATFTSEPVLGAGLVLVALVAGDLLTARAAPVEAARRAP